MKPDYYFVSSGIHVNNLLSTILLVTSCQQWPNASVIRLLLWMKFLFDWYYSIFRLSFRLDDDLYIPLEIVFFFPLKVRSQRLPIGLICCTVQCINLWKLVQTTADETNTKRSNVAGRIQKKKKKKKKKNPAHEYSFIHISALSVPW